jgi:chaperonin GroEL
MKNNLKLCTIIPPNFGYKRHELMHDIALSVGATYFSESTGDDLSLMSFKDLGRASKIIVGKDNTIILKDQDDLYKHDIDKRVEELWEAHKLATKKNDKDFIMSRIASLTGGVGVIRVGGNTDLEQKELYDRVDDAVCAVRSALVEGILPGGGLALWEAGEDITNSKSIAHAILGKALLAPLMQIIENAGVDWAPYGADVGHGLDVKTGKTGDMIKMGIIDPNKVTKTALQNAVSVAVTILSTNAIVTMARTYDSK